ncbi:MAG: HAMP domain-containing protein [Alphaproteobacteria bacterium]
MRAHSLNQSIFRLVIGLVVVTCLTILVNVWLVNYQQAQSKLAKDIELAQNVFGEVLENQEDLLFTSASVLTDDFGFKQAVATNDNGTITSVLSNHGNRISADLMAIFSLEGDTIVSTLKPTRSFNNEAFEAIKIYSQLIDTSLAQGGVSTFMIVDSRVYKVILLRIDAPKPMAIALVGFELTPNFIKKLKNTTQIQVGLLVRGTDSPQVPIYIENNNISKTKALNSLQVEELSWHHIAFSSDILVTQEFLYFENKDLNIQVVLTQRLSKLISKFSELTSNISLIIFIAIVITSIIAVLFSQRLAQPIRQLADAAQRISSGDYQQKIKAINDTKEFMHLSDALNNMQSSIRQREKQIILQAQHDTLTGLYTRYHAGNLIDEALQNQSLQGRGFHAVGINIVGFRDINDVFGYQYGDACLIEIASKIEQLSGLSARLSGGEFLWVPNINKPEEN